MYGLRLVSDERRWCHGGCGRSLFFWRDVMSTWGRIAVKEYGLSLLVCAVSSMAVGVIAAIRLPQTVGSPMVSGLASGIGIVPVSVGVLMSTACVSDRFSTRIIGSAVCAGRSRANIYASLVLVSAVFVFESIALCVLGCRVCESVMGPYNETIGSGWDIFGDILACAIPLAVFVFLGVFIALLAQEPAKATITMIMVLFSLVAIMMTLVQGGASCPLAMAHPIVFMRWLSERSLSYADVALGEGFAAFWVASLLGGSWLVLRGCELS